MWLRPDFFLASEASFLIVTKNLIYFWFLSNTILLPYNNSLLLGAIIKKWWFFKYYYMWSCQGYMYVDTSKETKIFNCRNIHIFFALGVQGWCSVDSTCLPPMWPRFNSHSWRHLGWVCWFSTLHRQVFLWVPQFLLSSKTNIWFDLIWFVLIWFHSLQCPQFVFQS